ncbi:DMT family transporter [Saccharophagus sp. K07]|uniref:DMT family transporter n=1 Tax=Saccharophagus sp. K07 TaxID=2283636 RepID=UPI001652666D|nr:DMT family transporter [Saccharophagus sp. K07]MBC6907453.1 DMT family transporter [Saccharophagus sp. K07]
MNRTHLATLVLLFSSTLWGLVWIPLKALEARGMHGLLLIALCYSAMAIVISPLAWRHRDYVFTHPLPLLGIFLVGGVANICFSLAMIYGEVVRVMVLFYLLPVWGALGGKFILGERTNIWRWLGVALAIMGAFILLGGFDILAMPPSWLDLLALLAGIFFAITIMLFRAVKTLPVSVKLNSLFLGGALISAVALLVGAGGEKGEFPSLTIILWTLLYALTWLLLANIGSQWAMTQLPAGRTSILMVMELVAAVLSAIWIGGEILTPQVVIGGLLIVSATAVEIWQGVTS